MVLSITIEYQQFLKRSISLINKTPIGNTTPGPASNGNEGVLYTPQSYRTGASPLDSV